MAVCAVGPEERKVPPKTPPQRLDTLCTMGRLYAESALNNDAYGIERNVTNILEAFDDRICPPLLAIYSKITDDVSFQKFLKLDRKKIFVVEND